MSQTNEFEKLVTLAQSDDEILLRRVTEMIGSEKLVEMRESGRKLKRLMSYYRCAILEVETKFKVLNEQFSLEHERNPIDSIKSRLKSPESIIEKLNRKNLPQNIASIEENLYDVAGIRVICSFEDDIYMLADCLLKQDDVKLIEAKDYIHNPEGNGYRVRAKNCSDSPTQITFSLTETHYPVDVQAKTVTSDPDLNRVFDVCAHTLKICRQMIHLDSTRHGEPLACTGDYYIESLMTAFTYGVCGLRRLTFAVPLNCSAIRTVGCSIRHTV